jgi:hypothetical protein
MKILVVDDDTFASGFEGAVYARTISEAREFLLNEHWDEVWLDHDLGNGEDVSKLTDEIEGMETILDVDWFCIHSMNPVGKERMYIALDRAGYKVAMFALPSERIN